MDDYKYLDSLLVTNSELGENGALYLQSIADLKSDDLVDAWRRALGRGTRNASHKLTPSTQSEQP